MHFINNFIYMLQAGEDGVGGDPEGAAPGGNYQFIVILVGMFVIFYFLLIRPQQKEQKRRKQMLSAVKKHDKIITTGGIHGVVVAVGESDITIKIDESNNVRVKFLRSAIATILSDEA